MLLFFWLLCDGPTKQRGQPMALCGGSIVLSRFFSPFSHQWRKRDMSLYIGVFLLLQETFNKDPTYIIA